MPPDQHRSITYAVLDSALQQAEPSRFATLFAAFVAGYTKFFSGDQAESTGEWKARIAGTALPQPVMRIVVAVERVHGEERVIGGIACEYYRAAGCVLATYLYVSDDEQHRHRGYARTLLDEARKACSRLGPVCALLVEAEWPETLTAAARLPGDLATSRERLRFFARLGARMLSIDYVQPPLGAGKQPVSYLRLFSLPVGADGSHPTDDELAAAVATFLAEFYAATAKETQMPADETALARLRRQLSERRPLTVPLPRLRLDDVALCFHFVESLDTTPGSDDLLKAVRDLHCPVFHSMESDLLSRAYRKRRLFRTVCLTKTVSSEPLDGDAGLVVEIAFPRRVTFRSENRREEREWPLRRRTVRAYLAPTFFFDGRVAVWHLTLKVERGARAPDGRGWLDELDVITLLKLADDDAGQELLSVPEEGAQERSLMDGVTFRLLNGHGAGLDVKGLLHAVAAVAQERLGDSPTPQSVSAPVAVTVELLGWTPDAHPPFFGITDRLEREALCGIVSGLLDFDELDDAEARDTLTPSVALDDALLCVHRETLVYVRQDDRAARTVAGTVGISPYLIIPYATVLCNEWLLRDLESRPLASRVAGSVSALSDEVARLEDTLRTKWVPNPFFYPMEKQLYDRALVASGTSARRAKIEELLLELKTHLQLAQETQRGKFEAMVAGLLGAISVLSFDALVVDVVPGLLNVVGLQLDTDGKLLGHVATLALACVFGLMIFAWKRPTPETHRPPRRS